MNNTPANEGMKYTMRSRLHETDQRGRNLAAMLVALCLVAASLATTASSTAAATSPALEAQQTDPTASLQSSGRSVVIELAEERTNCSNSSRPCRWLRATLAGFESGRYPVRCVWSQSSGGTEQEFANLSADFDDSLLPIYDRLCYFNGTIGRYLTVYFDGVRSNTIRFEDKMAVDSSPSAVRNLEIAAAGDEFRLSWDPPADSGSSALADYRIQVSRPGVGGGSGWSRTYTKSATLRSWTFTTAHEGTEYTFTFTAVNREGRRGPTNTVRATLRPNEARSPSAVRNLEIAAAGDEFRLSWDPPADSGSSALADYRIQVSRPGVGGGSGWSRTYTKSATLRSWTFTTAHEGTEYTFTFTAVNREGRRGPTNTVRATLRPNEARSPSAVRNLEIAAAGDEFRLSWDPPADSGSSALADYRIQVSRPGVGGGSGWSRTYTKSATLRSWPFNPGHEGTEYTFTFTAVNREGRHGPTNTVRATLRPNEARSPSAVRNLEIAAAGDEFRLSWDPPADSGSSALADYRIQVSRPGVGGDSGWSRTYTKSATLRSWPFTPGHEGTEYTFTFTAVNREGRHGPTNTVRATLRPNEARSPSAVRNLEIAAAGDEFRLSWDPPADSGSSALADYRIQVSRPGAGGDSGWSRTYTKSATLRSWTFTPGHEGTEYTFTFTAVNREGRRGPTNTVRATLRPNEARSPSAVRNLEIAAAGDEFRLSWDPPADSGSSALADYRIQVSRPGAGGDSGWSRTYTKSATLRSWPFNPGHEGTEYTFTFTAVNREGRRGPTNTVRATLRPNEARSPSAVRNLEIAAAGDEFRLSWDPPADSGSSALADYRIQVSRPGAGGDSGWSRTYTKSATLRSWPFNPAHEGTEYTFTFTAVNREGRRGPTNTVRATLRARTTGLDKVTDLDYEVGRHERSMGTLFSIDTISWDRVDGATSYDLEWKYPDPVHRNSDDADARCRGDRCSAEFPRNPEQRYIEVRVRARSGSRTGTWSNWKFGRESIECDATRRDTRWRTKVVGWRNHEIRIIADKDFWTSSGNPIKEGREGGKITGGVNISTSGCSWIFKDATVKENAHVSGNALVYGRAEVSGRAKVYDEARVFGKTRISGFAEIYGHAKVSGNAKVSGYVRVFGNERQHAVLTAQMDAWCALSDKDKDKCKYNGQLEYERAAREIYNQAYRTVYDEFDKCLPSNHSAADKDAYTKAELAERVGIAGALRQGCRITRAIDEFRGTSPSGWSVTIDVVLAFGGSIRNLHQLSRYAKSLIQIVEAVKTLSDLNEARNTIEEVSKIVDEIAQEECRKSQRCG